MNIEALKKSIILAEKLRLKPYRDTVGKLTIGVGRNLDDVGIYESEALAMLENDIAEKIHSIENELYFQTLKSDDVRLRVLIEMVFNLGKSGFEEFKKVISAIELKDFETASSEMLNSHWASQVGVRATRLAMMMKTGLDVPQ